MWFPGVGCPDAVIWAKTPESALHTAADYLYNETEDDITADD